MFNSLRTRLLFWQVVLLTAVVVSFGSVVFYQWRQSLFSELDAELLSSATVLEGTLRGAYTPDFEKRHHPPPDRRRPGRRGPKQSDKNGRDRPASHRAGHARAPNRPDSQSREGPIILAGEVPAEVFNLPHNLILNTNRRVSTYFVIYDINDQIIASSADRKYRIPLAPGGHQRFEFIGTKREVVLMGPGETRILVGRDTGGFKDQAIGFLARLTLVGLGILAVGCLAGYWVTGRAIAPIRAVSGTVQAISGTNLKSRIDPSKMDAEFVQLSILLNEMLDRLESTIEQQKRFIADASHELRTPVSVIGMHSELALSRERNSHEYQKTLKTCLRASNRLKSLTDDLLTLAKSDAGQLNRAREEVDLSQLVNESVEFLQPLADYHGVSLANRSPSSAIVRCDRQLLRQLIDNLLTNAIVHNQQGGQAMISVQSNEKGVTLQVRDNGPGISESELPNLFDRFHRINKSRSRQSGGCGLGLSICQSIARIHGGELSVKSQPGSGTIFVFAMPHDFDDA